MRSSKGKTILMVDDDRDIVDSTCFRLRNEGYDTIVAFDADQGIDSAIKHQPDLIILDVRMPGKNGLVALSELKRCDDTKHIPIVMLSASIVDKNGCLDGGARFFVKKPYASKQLVAAVDTAIDRNHSLSKAIS